MPGLRDLRPGVSHRGGPLRPTKPRVTLQAIADALDAHLGPAASPPRPAPPLVIHAGDPAALGLPDGIPELTVLVLGSVGMELWFAALALGASRVLLLRSGLLTATGTRLIEQQVDLARRLLRALGEAPERIRFVTDPQRLDWGGLPNPWPPADPGHLAVAEGKRHLLLAALGHLEEYLPSSSSPLSSSAGRPSARSRSTRSAAPCATPAWTSARPGPCTIASGP